jgi:transposase
MARPYDITKAFANLTPDFETLTALYKKEQKAYLRTRLRAIELLWQGHTRQGICAKLDIHRESLATWMQTLVTHGVVAGLKRLATAKHTPRARKLPPAAQTELPHLLETTQPTDHGYPQFIFTARVLTDLVAQRWQVQVTDQTIYNFLHQIRFSYQRAHRDYLNADPQAQLAYARRLAALLRQQAPTERIVFFDEFSLTNRPTLFYGWARTNTRFHVPSNERSRARVNGLLGVDARSGDLFLQLKPRARAVDLAPYFHDLALDTYRAGQNHLTLILDNCPSHKDTLRYEVWQALRAEPELQTFTLRWLNTPAYSPNLNLAEYLIHQIRLQVLHHSPATFTLEDIQTHLLTTLKDKVLQTTEQIKQTLYHILRLGGLTCRI